MGCGLATPQTMRANCLLLAVMIALGVSPLVSNLTEAV